jgi:hypothetical protein
MAILIDGNAMSFRAAAYGRPQPATINFLQQQFNDPSRALMFANSSFLERAQNVFEENYGDAAMARLEAVRRNLRKSWDLDEIRPLRTVEEMQNAKPVMQRWLMANPFIRTQFKQGRVAGFGDSYINHKKQGVGEDHYDYRLATSGFATFDDENGWKATTYGDELLEGDTRPSFLEQIDIFDSWCHAEGHLLHGKRDVTSPEDSEWG